MLLVYCWCRIFNICWGGAYIYIYQFYWLKFPVVRLQFVWFDCLRFHSFAQNLFNFISYSLLKTFTRFFFITIISLIFFIRIYLTIVLIPTLFSLWIYTGNIDVNIAGNFFSFFNICSAFLQTFIKPFRLFSNNKTIYNVFIVIFLLFHNIFHFTNVYSCLCACTFICWMESLFTTFIHMNITITWFFFLFVCSQSLFLELISIDNRSFLCFFASFLHVHIALMISNSFPFIKLFPCWFFRWYVQFFFDSFFSSTSDLTFWLCIQTCFLVLCILKTCLVRKK